jgi:hypothetical protein
MLQTGIDESISMLLRNIRRLQPAVASVAYRHKTEIRAPALFSTPSPNIFFAVGKCVSKRISDANATFPSSPLRDNCDVRPALVIGRDRRRQFEGRLPYRERSERLRFAPIQRFFSSSRDWILGSAVELRFPSYLSVEADGLHRKLHFTPAVEPDGALNSVSPSPVITLEAGCW